MKASRNSLVKTEFSLDSKIQNNLDFDNDADCVANRILKLGNFLSKNYFRTKFICKEDEIHDLNARKNIIFAANHSGMSFPWDSFILQIELTALLGNKRKLVALLAPALMSSRLMSPYGLDIVWSYFCTPASTKNFEQQAWKKNNIFIHPEGVAGIGKGFNNKYKLQKFSSSMIRVSLQYNLPIVPVYIVNGEYLNPFAYKINSLNKVINQLGIPFLPISPMIFPLLVFPFVFYMSLPANLHYIVDKAIFLKDFTDKKYEDLSVEEIREITKNVQQRMQQGLDENVALYGQKPFDMPSFFAKVRHLGLQSFKLLPLTWSFQFHQAAKYKHTLSSDLKNAFIKLSLSLPIIGWPLYLLCVLVFPMPKQDNAD